DTGSGFQNIGGATTTGLILINVSASSNGYYRAVFTDNFGYQAFTNAARLTVDYVTTNPSDQTINFGQSATFMAASSNPSGTDTIQWQVNTGSGFTDIPGATSGTLTLPNPTVAQNNGAQYRAKFTNSGGSFFSTAAGLHVNAVKPTLFVAVS